MTARFTDGDGLKGEQWDAIERLGDAVIPAFDEMPSASAVNAVTGVRRMVLPVRRDLVPGLARAADFALAAGADRPAEEIVSALIQSDSEAFDSLFRAVAGAYYADPRVRDLLGYPGQVAHSYDLSLTPEYVTNGWLDRVLARGPRYRAVPETQTAESKEGL